MKYQQPIGGSITGSTVDFVPEETLTRRGPIFVGLGKDLVRLDKFDAARVNWGRCLWNVCQINRFCGGTDEPCSVGQHMLAAYELANGVKGDPFVCQALLCHDLHEALCGDIPYPIKQAFPDLNIFEHALCRDTVAHFMGRAMHAKEAELVEYFDKLMMVAEARELAHDPDWAVAMAQDRGYSEMQIVSAVARIREVKRFNPGVLYYKLLKAYREAFNQIYFEGRSL